VVVRYYGRASSWDAYKIIHMNFQNTALSNQIVCKKSKQCVVQCICTCTEKHKTAEQQYHYCVTKMQLGLCNK